MIRRKGCLEELREGKVCFPDFFQTLNVSLFLMFLLYILSFF